MTSEADAQQERELVAEYRKTRDELDVINTRKKELEKKSAGIEAKLVEIMTEKQATSTAKYQGVGFVGLEKPRIYGSIPVENIEQAFEYFRSIGLSDIIKESIHPGTLSSYVKETIENGGEVPEFISYYMKPTVKLYRR